MRTISLGRCGITVSAVGLGGIQFSKIHARQVAAVLVTARAEGINFLETAYGYFDSEEKMGAALRGRRDGLVIASKNWQTDGKEFTRCLEESLRRLRIDRFDIYQLHGLDERAGLEKALAKGGALPAAAAAIAAGKIRTLGVTTHSMDMCMEFLKRDLFDTIQYPISLINTEVPRSGLLGKARKQGIGLIAMKPLGGGRIGDPRLALGYVYRWAGVVPVVGVETPAQVRELAQIADRPPRLGRRDCAAIGRIRRELGAGFCRACRYCEPCPQGIRIFQAMYLPIYFRQMGAKRVFAKGWPEWMKQASTCTACGRCEAHCPFHLKIIDTMRANLAIARREFAALAK